MEPAASRADTDAIGAEIRRAVTLLCEPGGVYELRILHTRRGTAVGYFDDLDKLAAAAKTWDGKAPAVYVLPNPCAPTLLARANNRVVEYAKHTAADADIVRRRRLPIDIDAVRPAGISSTNAEHDAALAVAREARGWLIEHGMPSDSVLSGDSGNGGHLVGYIDLPNDAASTELCQRVLLALDRRFSTETVHVDLTTYNAARIWKLYGTMVRKGDALPPDRPHRRARLLEVPEGSRVRTAEHSSSLRNVRWTRRMTATRPRT